MKGFLIGFRRADSFMDSMLSLLADSASVPCFNNRRASPAPWFIIPMNGL